MSQQKKPFDAPTCSVSSPILADLLVKSNWDTFSYKIPDISQAATQETEE